MVRLNDIETGKIKPVQEDYYNMKIFEVKRFEVQRNLLSSLVKHGTNLKVLHDKEVFDVLIKLHLRKGHCGRDSLKNCVKTYYSNITEGSIRTFLRTCKFCQTKHGRLKEQGEASSLEDLCAPFINYQL